MSISKQKDVITRGLKQKDVVMNKPKQKEVVMTKPKQKDVMMNKPKQKDVTVNPLDKKFVTSKTFTVVKPEDRITSDVMTLYEYTEVISIRAAQIQANAKTFTNVDLLDDPIKMAEKEIYDRKCPLSIKRNINENEVEIWEVNELAIPPL